MPGGRITDEDIQKVRDASDIVAVFSERVPVKQRGRDFWCCCPFHNEKSPSCKIDPALQLWHCFGCGEGGEDVYKRQYLTLTSRSTEIGSTARAVHSVCSTVSIRDTKRFSRAR